MKTTFRTDSDHDDIYAVVGSNEITDKIQQAIAKDGSCAVESFGKFDHPDYPNSSDWNLSLFQVGGELVGATKDAVTWKTDDPKAFAEMLEVYGAEGEYTYPTSPNSDIGYVLMRRLGKNEQWLSFTPQGRTAIERPLEHLDGDWHGSRGRIYTAQP
ncbi:MAG: hypothetical protein QM758_01280 [Armatimonas sp.]